MLYNKGVQDNKITSELNSLLDTVVSAKMTDTRFTKVHVDLGKSRKFIVIRKWIFIHTADPVARHC